MIDPQRNLWRAVFVQVLIDAMGPELYLKRPAMDWLFADKYETDRNAVLDLAGLTLNGWDHKLRRLLLTTGDRVSRKDAKAIVITLFSRHTDD